MKQIINVLLGALAAVLAFIYYELRRQARPKASFDTFDNTPQLHRGEDQCVWCGRAFPEPDYFGDNEVTYQKAMKPWVMQSYGDGRMPVMACEPLHLELWYMLPASARQ